MRNVFTANEKHEVKSKHLYLQEVAINQPKKFWRNLQCQLPNYAVVVQGSEDLGRLIDLSVIAYSSYWVRLAYV